MEHIQFIASHVIAAFFGAAVCLFAMVLVTASKVEPADFFNEAPNVESENQSVTVKVLETIRLDSNSEIKEDPNGLTGWNLYTNGVHVRSLTDFEESLVKASILQTWKFTLPELMSAEKKDSVIS
ncbi:MAG: hypothetical protein LLG05_07785 [Porphyromonadaceae bacterium]|nr:hypothetical protein [Porphyromonadaceae bacterium]